MVVEHESGLMTRPTDHVGLSDPAKVLIHGRRRLLRVSLILGLDRVLSLITSQQADLVRSVVSFSLFSTEVVWM
jgi:hypothetical protein